ncbi:hypothetical protein MACJ_003506 [Theileria orientalis]|uniref:Uncharacterized protein n=1 Tax=Theileria orientalis TaxID=68886 RepID=A0A976XJS9_THEOR|nr:hypothetical protein MACJ_003506 [Theileria orientalis]
MSSNLRKLRFMQKGEDKPQPPTEKVVNTLIGDDSVWIREGFEDFHKRYDEKTENKQKYHKIKYMTRLSFNGANPCIEAFMVKLKRRPVG